jgi:hypothetical protein
VSRWLTVVRAFSWRRLTPALGLVAVAVSLVLAGCDAGTVRLPPIPTVAAGSSAATSLTVSGAVNGTLTSPGAACVPGGPAGVTVTIQGIVDGANYLLTFNAPGGTTNLTSATSPHIVVEFAPLQGAGNWGANPNRHLGSGTLVVNATAGKVDLHLVAGPGNAPATTVDIAGSYGCSSSAVAPNAPQPLP